MKSIKKILITTAVVSLVSTSCSNDYLETSPSTSIGQKEAENTEKGLLAIVEGLNSMMYNYSWGSNNTTLFGAGQHSIGAQLDMLGDDLINTRPAYYMTMYRWEDHTNVNGVVNYNTWDFYYTIILHANMAIAGADKTAMPDSSRQQVLGQAYAFRAWAYHNLVQLFGKRYVKGQSNDQLGVIIRTPENQFEKAARSTVEEVYNLIDKDLQLALDYLDKLERESKIIKGKNSIRYATACGIAARVALSKSDWANAAKYADLAISRSGATLQKGAALNDGFNNYAATEWIWGYKQGSTQDNKYYNFNANYSYNFQGYNRSLRFAINRTIFDKMGSKDYRRNWWVALDKGNSIPSDAYDQYFAGGTTTPTWEITGQSIKFKAASSTSTVGDALIMRLAEMYYIKAEAEARGGFGNPQNTLNTIMVTRDEDYNTNLVGNALIDEIMRNKRIDLWLEGQRFFDMKRLGEVPKRLEAKNFDYLTGVVKTTALNRNTGNFAVKIPTNADSKYWQFAIPYNEIKGNPLCQQNEL